MPISNRSVNLTFGLQTPDPVAMAKFGAHLMDDNFTHPDDPARPYGLPYAVIGDQLSVFADSVGVLPNPLTPAIWKAASTGDTISASLVAYTKQKFPDFLECPTDFSVPIESSWEVYKRTHTPPA